MKAYLAVVTLFLAAAAVSAENFDYELDTDLAQGADARLFFVNFTSSLVQVNATILAYGLLFLAILGAAAVALYYLYLESQNSGGSGYGYSYGQQGNQYGYQYARSSDAAPEFNAMKIIEWMAVFREMYDSFDPNDLECQKRLICDVVKNEAYYGAGAAKLKSGFRAAKFLEYVSLPDDIRELVDEYLDANARAEQDKDCSEYFQCPFSINDSAKRNLNQL